MKKCLLFVMLISLCLLTMIACNNSPETENNELTQYDEQVTPGAIAFYVGKEPIDFAEFNFHIVSAMNAYMKTEEGKTSGFNPNLPLAEQKYPDSDLTYEDIFDQNAKDDIRRVICFYKESQANGYTMGEWEKDSIESFFKGLDAYIEREKITEEKAILNIYGYEMSRERIQMILERGVIGEAYERHLSDNKVFTDEEIERFYQQHKNQVAMADVNAVSLRLLHLSGKQTALDVLEKYEAGDKSEDSFIELINQYATDEQEIQAGGLIVDLTPVSRKESSFDETEKWVFDKERKPGDYTILEMGGAYQLAYFVAQGEPMWKLWCREAMMNEYIQSILDNYQITYPE